MKKLISRRNFLKVCALAGSAAALSACGGGKSTGSGNSAAAAVDTTGAVTFPLSEKVTFTGMTSFPVGSEPEPNNRTIFKRLEEQTNVHIDWTAIQSDQWSDKITLNMSNPNTLTDFVFTADFTDSNLLRYADQGVILNLEDYIDNNMPNLQKVFEQYPEYRTMCTDSDGHIWALPWIEQLGSEKTAIQTIGNMSFINTKWLNFLGLSMPTTVDEFEQVLMAFRDNAASIKAEYGIDGDIIPMSCIVNNGDQTPASSSMVSAKATAMQTKTVISPLPTTGKSSVPPPSRATVMVWTGCTSCMPRSSSTRSASRRSGPPMFPRARLAAMVSASAGMLPTLTT